MKLYHNLFCRDIEAQLRFYQGLLGLPEAVHSRSPIYRAVEAPGFQFGFHAAPAYSLLHLDNRVPEGGLAPTTGYTTLWGTTLWRRLLSQRRGALYSVF